MASLPKTRERYTEICTNHLIPTLGEHSPPTPNSNWISRAAYARTGEETRPEGWPRGGLSERTILHHHRILRMALTRAVELEPDCYEIPLTNPRSRRPNLKPKRSPSLDEDQSGILLLMSLKGTDLHMSQL